MFQEKKYHKSYLAIARGEIKEEIRIDKGLDREGLVIGVRMKVCDDGKESVTIIKPIKYNKENGVLEISETDEGKSVVLNIKDSGIGIPDENRERVFLEYERIRGTKAKGTGLGLPLAKRLIELNDGEIWFDSQVEKGTTFHLRFKKV